MVQVAIIRPGPIVGKMMNPYMKRRQGREPVRYAHPSLEPILKRTLGVPLFQEQLLRIAMIAANFTGGEAEDLRRAMGHKRSRERMLEIENKLRRGMEQNGIGAEAQEEIITSIASFALYGFPESHAASFALIAYASAYLKCHYLAAFTAALLNNQPMGFYSAATIVKDAQRHGLKVKPVDVLHSEWLCTLEPVNSLEEKLPSSYEEGMPGQRPRRGWSVKSTHAVDREPAILQTTPAAAAGCCPPLLIQGGESMPLSSTPILRLGLRYVRGLRKGSAEALVRARAAGAVCIHRRPDPASSGTQQERMDDACTSWSLEWIGRSLSSTRRALAGGTGHSPGRRAVQTESAGRHTVAAVSNDR